MTYDVAIIGGGINGCGIARDAAGRGLSVYLCDKGDIGGATSSSSTKLIHGGLRYLEFCEFGLVKKALKERRVIQRIAPNVVEPMRFVLPYKEQLRPWWMIRMGLFVYDFLAGSENRLSRSSGVNLTYDNNLKDDFSKGFEYSDCRVNDNRLVILNALDAQGFGATISPYTKCEKAEVENGIWNLTTSKNGEKEVVKAKIIINAAGPWAQKFIENAVVDIEARQLRLVKGSHIVVPKIFDHEKAYIFQHEDNRVIFAIPYNNDFTLIGTTDKEVTCDPADVTCSAEEVAYLCDAVNGYFKKQIKPTDVVWSYAGVRPLIDERNKSSSNVTRDYLFSLRDDLGAPLVNIWGGKLTTYRILAEEVLERVSKVLACKQKWTAHKKLISSCDENYYKKTYGRISLVAI